MVVYSALFWLEVVADFNLKSSILSLYKFCGTITAGHYKPLTQSLVCLCSMLHLGAGLLVCGMPQSLSLRRWRGRLQVGAVCAAV